MNRALSSSLLALSVAFLYFSPAACQEYAGILETTYTTLHYPNEKDLDEFLWKIGRVRLRPEGANSLAKARVDRLVERVEEILDMHPPDFRIDIFLKDGYREGNIAYYSADSKSITIYTEFVTDGVLAHELAHAVMHAYFNASIGRKAQEMLCRYVDAHLWKDY